MKKLEELGISPWPWTAHIDSFGIMQGIFNADNKIIVETDCGVYPPEIPDALLMASALKLYDAAFKTEAVLEKLFTLDEFAALLKSGAADALIACREELRSALAKASGEGEV